MTDPELISPMLAASGALPAGAGWAFEFKYDGVRAVCYVDDGGVRAFSRNHNEITASYPELQELGALLAGHRAVVDGEIVALEPGDRPSFSRLQQRMHNADPSPSLVASVPVLYYAFDLLALDGTPVLDIPYGQRRTLLAELRLTGEHVRTPAHFTDADGATVLKAAELAGLEGVVAKRVDGPYRPGRRSFDWTKVPLVRTQEVIVIGTKAGEGRRAGTIGSLLLGVFDEQDRLTFAGHVGTGFTGAALRELEKQLAPLARTTAPISGVPREHARHARWVEPALVGEVAFRTWTPDGRLRHASWRGLRTDRTPRSAHRGPMPVPPASPGVVEGALQTTDGRWRVEAVRLDQQRFFRLIHGDNVIDGLTITDVEQLLTEAGLDLADLAETQPPSSRDSRTGVA